MASRTRSSRRGWPGGGEGGTPDIYVVPDIYICVVARAAADSGGWLRPKGPERDRVSKLGNLRNAVLPLGPRGAAHQVDGPGLGGQGVAVPAAGGLAPESE